MINYHLCPCLLVENYSKTLGNLESSFMQNAWMNTRTSEAFGCEEKLKADAICLTNVAFDIRLQPGSDIKVPKTGRDQSNR